MLLLLLLLLFSPGGGVGPIEFEFSSKVPKGDVDPLFLPLCSFSLSRSLSLSLSPTIIVKALIPSVGLMAGLCFFRALPPSSPLGDAVRLLLLVLVVPKLAEVRCILLFPLVVVAPPPAEPDPPPPRPAKDTAEDPPEDEDPIAEEAEADVVV